MSIFREIPPTAGFPLLLKDILRALFNTKKAKTFEEDLKRYLNAPYADVTYSGTAALYFILKNLKELSPKKTVVVSSFICPLVPLAIQRAGLKVAVCDINKHNFNFDTEELKNLCSTGDILAIIALHLGGIPADLDTINKIAKEIKAFVIEDCAQSLGAEYKGRKAGTLSDFSFFSLCRGKGLTIYEGGVIVTNKTGLMPALGKKINPIIKKGLFSEAIKIFEVFGYYLFYRPELFWFIFRLPQIYWEKRGQPLKAMIEYFSSDFPTHDVSKFRKRIGDAQFSRLDKEVEKQRQKALYYIENLKNIKGLNLITESTQDKASYPYLTLVFDEPSKRKKAAEILKKTGLGISQIYCFAITDYDYLKGITGNKLMPNARSLAQRHLTLSTSTFLKKSELDKVINKIKEL